MWSAEQRRRGMEDAAFEGGERGVALGMGCLLGDEAVARGDDAAGEHEVVVAGERLDGHAVGIFVLAGWPQTHGAAAKGGDAVMEQARVIGIGPGTRSVDFRPNF